MDRKKWIGLGVGVLAVLATVGAAIGCARLPAPFADLCVAASNALIDQGKQAALEAAEPAGSDAGRAELLELCPGGPDGPLCTSVGYALPLPDGGRCRCR